MADRIAGLREALELTPDNDALRLLLAEALAEEGSPAEASAEPAKVMGPRTPSTS